MSSPLPSPPLCSYPLTFDSSFPGKSAKGSVSVSIMSKNDAPVGARMQVMSSTSSGSDQTRATLITLGSSDVDSVPFLGAKPSYRITKTPAVGKLYSVMADGITLAGPLALDSTSATIQTFSYAFRVVGFRTQYSYCEGMSPDTKCNFETDTLCLAGAKCVDKSYHAEMVVGPPNAYPIYGDSANAWCPWNANAGNSHTWYQTESGDEDWVITNGVRGTEFLDIELANAMFIRKVSIYENLAAGAVVGVFGAETYSTSNTTAWTTLWAGTEPTPAADTAWEFTPTRLCASSTASRYVRILLDTKANPGWNEIDAVYVEGTLTREPGVVSANNIVAYVPPRGVSR